MKTTDSKIFVWYADHPRHGNLILAIPCAQSYKYGLIYAPRMIFERMRGKLNVLQALELNTGPMGFIPHKFYQETSITFLVPFWLRLIAIRDAYAEKLGYAENYLEPEGPRMTQFILETWEDLTLI